jgi:type II pantothenate kinase
MKIKVGLDIGGSTTKIVGINDGKLVAKAIVKAADPVASAYGAVGKLVNDNNLKIEDIEQINMTGVGASFPTAPILGIKTVSVKEFMATGLGGLYLSGLEKAVVVSMGTGTAYLYANKDEVTHIIGSGVGGGTLIGLCNSAVGVADPMRLSELAETGDTNNLDLTIGDITKDAIPGLPMNATAANFGKALDAVKKEDVSAGVFNLVYQSIGTMSVLASRCCGVNDIVYTGQLTSFKQCRDYLMPFKDLYNANFIIPEDAVFATAVGSCLAGE